MKGSAKIISAFGIPVKIHWTFTFLIAYVFITAIINDEGLSGALMSIGFVFTIFACVVLHELGHALVARHFGIGTKDITLLPIGGAAALDEIPASSWKEFWIALAGPAVNLLIIITLWPIHTILWGPIFGDGLFEMQVNLQSFISSLLIVNFALVIFNLIPAFPMDGGRVLRSLLALRLDRLTATRWAVNVGKGFAVIFALLGVFYNPFLVLIALFIFLSGTAEYKALKHAKLIRNISVREILNFNFQTISRYESLLMARLIIKETAVDYFVLLDEWDNFYGIITAGSINQKLSEDSELESVSKRALLRHRRIDADGSLVKYYLGILRQDDFPYLAFSGRQFVGMVDKQKLLILLNGFKRRRRLLTMAVNAKNSFRKQG
jgi:Zn-dependent protease